VDRFANNDDVYPELEAHDQKLGDLMQTNARDSLISSDSQTFGLDREPVSSSDRIRMDNESRKPRTMEEMEQEAQWLKSLFDDTITHSHP
jgi:bis(5'-adenosyl)-triphosphatase